MKRVVALSMLAMSTAACGSSLDGEAQQACANAVNRYQKLYVDRWGEHEDAAFDEILQAARVYEDEGGDCATLAALAEEIQNARMGVATAAASSTPRGAQQTNASGSIAALVLFIIAIIVICAGNLWAIVVAFQESVVWGLLYLFVPLANIAFIVSHWDRAKNPFMVQLGGVAIMLLGTWAGGLSASDLAAASQR